MNSGNKCKVVSELLHPPLSTINQQAGPHTAQPHGVCHNKQTHILAAETCIAGTAAFHANNTAQGRTWHTSSTRAMLLASFCQRATTARSSRSRLSGHRRASTTEELGWEAT